MLGLLTGCALLPGMTVNNNQANAENTSTDLNPTIVPITPSVIAQFQSVLNPYVYYIGVGDMLSITIWGHPEFNSPAGQNLGSPSVLATASQGSQLPGLSNVFLNNTASTNTAGTGYLVNPDGTIFFPLLGNVSIAGLTEQQASQLMMQKLSRYIKNPQVMVNVSGFASQKVYILGDLNSGIQGATALLPITNTPMTLAYALSAVGGVNQTTADTSEIYVIRGSFTHPTVYWLNAESPAAMLYADNFPLTNHDVVFVSTAAIVRWNNVLSQILPTVQTLWFTKSLVNP